MITTVFRLHQKCSVGVPFHQLATRSSDTTAGLAAQLQRCMPTLTSPAMRQVSLLLVAALHSKMRTYILFHPVVSSFFFFYFLAWCQRSDIGCLPYFDTWRGLSANLECRSKCAARGSLKNTGCKNDAKTRHLGTIAQLSGYWNHFVSLGHPSKFQRLSRLGSVTARYSNSGRQPNFAVLNRGCHLYSAGRPSRWALAHILVSVNFRAAQSLTAISCSCLYKHNVFCDISHGTSCSCLYKHNVFCDISHGSVNLVQCILCVISSVQILATPS